MNQDTFNTHRANLEAVAQLLNMNLDAKFDDGLYGRVKLVPTPDKPGPSILLDAFTYGAKKGQGRAYVLLPVNRWGHPVKPRNGGSMPECSFKLDKAPKLIASQIAKLIDCPEYVGAMQQLVNMEEMHSKRVSMGVALAASMKEQGVKFEEGHRNGYAPDHNGHVDIAYHIPGLGSIEVGHGVYYLKTYGLNGSPVDIAKAIKLLKP